MRLRVRAWGRGGRWRFRCNWNSIRVRGHGGMKWSTRGMGRSSTSNTKTRGIFGVVFRKNCWIQRLGSWGVVWNLFGRIHWICGTRSGGRSDLLPCNRCQSGGATNVCWRSNSTHVSKNYREAEKGESTKLVWATRVWGVKVMRRVSFCETEGRKSVLQIREISLTYKYLSTMIRGLWGDHGDYEDIGPKDRGLVSCDIYDYMRENIRE